MAASKDEPSWRDNGARATDDEGTEFDRFEGLTRRLLKVPKSELDAKRKAEAKAKARRKPKTA